MAPFSTDPKFITASIELLYFYDVGSGKSTAVPLDWENGIGADVSATSDGFVAGLAAGHRSRCRATWRPVFNGTMTWKRTSLEATWRKNIERFDVTPDSKSIVLRILNLQRNAAALPCAARRRQAGFACSVDAFE